MSVERPLTKLQEACEEQAQRDLAMNTRMTARFLTLILIGLYAATSLADDSKPSLPLESIFRSIGLDNLQWSDDGTRFTYTRRDPATGLLDKEKL